MVRPRTILIVCLIMMADSRVDKQESLPNRRLRDKHEMPDQELDYMDLDMGSGFTSEEPARHRRLRDKHEMANQELDYMNLDKGSGLTSKELAKDRSVRDNHEMPDQEPDYIDLDMGSGFTSGDLANQMDYKLPDMDKRQSSAPKKKIHRAFGWIVGTMLTLATIILLIGTLSLTSRGTQTTGEEETRGRWGG